MAIASDDLVAPRAPALAHWLGTREHPRFLACFVIMLVITAFKSTDFLSMPQFWCEDGNVFFGQQLGHGVPQILVPYAGYLDVIPRLVAWLSSALPFTLQPAAYSIIAALLSAAAFATVMYRLAPFLPPFVLALSVLTAWGSDEVFGNLTNVQWFLNWALIALTLTPTINTSRQAVASFWIALVLGLTGPFSIILAPTAFIVLVLVTQRPAWIRRFDISEQYLFKLNTWTAAGVLVAAVIQASVLHITSHGGPSLNLATIYNVLLITAFFQVPLHVLGRLPASPPLFLALILLLLFAVWYGKHRGTGAKLAITLFVGLSVVCAISGLIVSPKPFLLALYAHDRYLFFAKVTLCWLFWLALSANWGSKRHWPTIIVAAALLGWAAQNADRVRRGHQVDMQWAANVAQLSEPGRHSIALLNGDEWTLLVDTDADGVPHALPSKWWVSGRDWGKPSETRAVAP